MNLLGKRMKLRGSLGRDARVSASMTGTDGSCVVLAVLLQSIASDGPTGLQTVRNIQMPVVCPAPHFCGVHDGMEEGDTIEAIGEFRRCEEDGPVVWMHEPRVMRISGLKFCAHDVRKIDRSDEDDDS